MKILLIEDDEFLSTRLAQVLTANHYLLEVARDGQAGLELATRIEYDLILLDVQLPELDGMAVCRQLRSQGYRQPILMISADDRDATAVAGFEAGADDYISKPCAPEVLLAKMRTLLRRSGAIVAPHRSAKALTLLTWDGLCLDWDAAQVSVDSQIITLTATEYNLLELFLRNPQRIFSRSAILDRLWGFVDAPTDRAVITHIKDLRKKLKAGGLAEDPIETIYGMGYRLKPPPTVPVPRSFVTDRIVEQFQASLEARLMILEQAKAAALAGDLTPELRQAAKQEAHKLAGIPADFGYPEASQFARSLEHLLAQSSSLTASENSRCVELMTALQRLLSPAPIAPDSPAPPAPPADPPACPVLVIDDDALLTAHLMSEAAVWGVQMQVVASLAAARSHLASSVPEVILLDLSFPDEEDSLSLLQDITRQFPQLPVIVFTGRDSLADRLAVSRLGARQFLHKPATTEQIFQAIAQIRTTPQRSTAKVLIIDDDPEILALLSSMLTPWGLETITLSDPQQFWEVLVTTSPDLLLLDLEMPGVSGLELCQVVRQDAQRGDLPILVVTAHTDAQFLQQAFTAGADDFITKPVLGPELVTRVLSRIERTR
jgi:DNA-binding response OmpR family regulator